MLAALLTACEGEQGPPGPPGFDGGIVVSSAFEIEIDFNIANDFSFVEPYGFDVFPSDVTLVYILWDTIEGQDIWRLLPQNVLFENGVLIYNYDFTQSDVRFFLDGSVNLAALDPVWTQNQTFRVVVVPADNVDGLDTSDFNAVVNTLGIDSFEVH